jgi:hypothetical protein
LVDAFVYRKAFPWKKPSIANRLNAAPQGNCQQLPVDPDRGYCVFLFFLFWFSSLVIRGKTTSINIDNDLKKGRFGKRIVMYCKFNTCVVVFVSRNTHGSTLVCCHPA